MYAATADWGEFAPPPPPAQLRALGLAIVAHVLLLGALAWGVNWRHVDTTLTVEAELWSAVAQQAAPKLEAPPPPPEPAPAPVARPAPPPPPPPDLAQRNADIALARQKQEAEALAEKQKLEQEQKRRQKIEAEKKEAQKRELEQKRLAQEKLDKERQKKLADDKKAAEKKLAQDAQKKEEAARAEKDLKAQREANLRRMMGLAGATGAETSTGTAQRPPARRPAMRKSRREGETQYCVHRRHRRQPDGGSRSAHGAGRQHPQPQAGQIQRQQRPGTTRCSRPSTRPTSSRWTPTGACQSTGHQIPSQRLNVDEAISLSIR